MGARWHGLRLRLRALVRGRRQDQDLQDEIAFHLEMREAQLRQSGADDAPTAARRRFGSFARIREEMRDEWAVLPRLTTLVQDCRYSARALRRSATFSGIVVLTLALGIGANTAVFSVVNAVLIRPLGFADADRLVLLHEGVPAVGISRVPFSAPDLADVRREVRAFDAVGAFRSGAVELSGQSGEPERVPIARVSADLFPMLGVQPLMGRLFSAAEDAPGSDLALISWSLWQRRYAANPAIVGQAILLDRRPYTVIGIMPPALQFPSRGPGFNNEPGQIWIPIAFAAYELQRGGGFENSGLARLRSGATLAQARAELDALAPRVQAQYPPALRSRARAKLVLFADPLRDEIVGDVGKPLVMLLGAIGLVLLVACANVANLLLSRAASRQHEIGLRMALGASRVRLLQLQFSEPLLLAAAGGMLGVVLAHLALGAVPSVVAERVPGLHEVSIDFRVLAFTAAVSLVTAVLVALVPALTAERREPSEALQDSAARTTGHRRHRMQGALVVLTVALSFVLLVSAGLFLRSFAALVASDRGFRPAGVLTASVSLPWTVYPTADRVYAFHEALLRRVAALPGVQKAALSSDLPLEGRLFSVFSPEGRVDGMIPPARRSLIYGSYFETLGLSLRRGRRFTPEEYDTDRRVVIVNEKLAARYWPGADPVGKRLKWGAAGNANPWLTIVGVVNDAVDGRNAVTTMDDERPVHVYEPFRQTPEFVVNARGSITGRELRLSIRTATDPAGFATAVRAQLAELDRQLAIANVATMEARVRDTMAPQRFSTAVITAFAAGALLLVSIGLYGLLGFVVSERTREIGIRLALGAEPQLVRRLMVKHGLQLVAAGIALGLVAALGTTRWLSSLLYETRSVDPMTFLAVPAVLLAVAVVACLIPAYRASRVDPLVALRGD